MLTALILTRDEERHIARAIESVKACADKIIVVDSGSTDRTVEIAVENGAEVLRNEWTNYATQFNWALDQLDSSPEWILRLDADEIVSEQLLAEIVATLPELGPEIAGLTVNRRMSFMGRVIRHGGLFPVQVLRIFRRNEGRCEDRWMDEHVIVKGGVRHLKGELLDDNLNSLTWWTNKHNSYASREVIDLLNLQYKFRPHDTVASLSGGEAGLKRWLKENIYTHLPGGARAFIYFVFRYVLRGGFLDGREGLAFHFLQGLWYRFLVDAKLLEVRRLIQREGVTPEDALKRVTGFDVAKRAA
ncbi:glycosyltransferase family 2 protein [Parafrankia sp. BMG5.11]|uniref:glycosyltransferase family 2 protein n=1 Tax=Parafrankia sp. BMG5.11 TaxID=222540 RepID=UPI00103F3716|nr:glycosyltransferase family 2 protein [Parafrankia sp. BMG5.11]TCJ39574.1 glycosyltransferase family 2 protein [Parafrankia sp. BMG5.11]